MIVSVLPEALLLPLMKPAAMLERPVWQGNEGDLWL